MTPECLLLLTVDISISSHCLFMKTPTQAEMLLHVVLYGYHCDGPIPGDKLLSICTVLYLGPDDTAINTHTSHIISNINNTTSSTMMMPGKDFLGGFD